jgi:uncharacterized protein
MVKESRPLTSIDHRLVEWLLRPEKYGDQSSAVELVETHISWVFLTARFAYKLKKPVRFDFLDFSTVERRRAACEDELRLNRRLAPAVYLGRIAIRRDAAGSLYLDESDLRPPTDASDANIVDWLVKMQRLPNDRTLDQLALAGRLPDAALGQLSARLADFYRTAPVDPIGPSAYRGEIERHVRANRAALLAANVTHAVRAAGSEEPPATPLDPIIRRVHGAQFQMLTLQPQLFDARIAARRVVDGHGDLRPEHIYLLPEPVVIDCIEFKPEFRRLDVADELSFLASECDYLGIGETGRRIAERCLTALNDQPPPELMAFYRCYRACVRAKVAVLRGSQLAAADRDRALNEARDHLRWADRYAGEMGAAAGPLVFVVRGLMGSGKSTLAAALAEQFGAAHLQTDAIRQVLIGGVGHVVRAAAYNEGLYRPEARRAVYDRMFQIAGEQLAERLSVVLDGTFLSEELRQEAAALAARLGARMCGIRCVCPSDVALKRLADRAAAGNDLSEARPELFAQQQAAEDPDSPDRETITVDTTGPTAEQLMTVLRFSPYR